MRTLPQVGDEAVMVQLGMRRATWVVAVEGRTVVVAGEDGERTAFELNELTGNWVRRGDPYYGVRLILRGS